MHNLQKIITTYLTFCQDQKRLDNKTIKAYKIDLSQFTHFLSDDFSKSIDSKSLEGFITLLHQTYKPKTVKRKIASIKAFYHYMEYKEIIQINPFNKIQIKFREPVTLPKIIPMNTIQTFFQLYIGKKT